MIVCFIGISSVNAQFEKGKMLLGVSSSSNLSALMAEFYNGSPNLMNFGFSTIKFKSDSDDGESEKLRNFNISPRFGYFIVNNLAIGIDLNLSRTGFGTGDDKEIMTLLGIGPFARYYLPGKKISPFLELSGSFGSITDKYLDWNDEQVKNKQSVNSFCGGIGLAIPLAERVKLDIMGGYSSSTVKSREDNEDNARLISNTLGFKIGFLILLGSEQ